jgi:hypothetical protein
VRPQAHDIAVPPFPPGTQWVGPEPGAVERICARGPLLVHFLDAAHLSSVRTLPYVGAWEERYRELGLTLVGVNSPRFPFTANPDKLAAALTRLEVGFPVAVDSSYRIWHDYGCEGWPSLFVWGRGGALRWFHFGEGEYAATEEAIQGELRELDTLAAPPQPLDPLRPSDAPGALVAVPSDEVFPGGSPSEPWRPDEPGARLETDYAAGGAHASLDGTGELRVAIDGADPRAIEIEGPGLIDLALHPRHQQHHLAVEPGDGLAIYSLSFSAGLP